MDGCFPQIGGARSQDIPLVFYGESLFINSWGTNHENVELDHLKLVVNPGYNDIMDGFFLHKELRDWNKK